MPSLRSSVPVAVLLTGCGLLGAGVAGVARVDAPLQAAVEQRPPVVQEHPVDVTWHHHRHRGGCDGHGPRDRRET